MRVFVVLDLVFSIHTKPRDWLGKRLPNDPLCVEWDIESQLNQSILHPRYTNVSGFYYQYSGKIQQSGG